MKIEITVPVFPEPPENAEISQIYIAEGQVVDVNQILFDVETEKVVLEVVAPAHGVIEQINITQGQVVSPGTLAMQLREIKVAKSPVQETKAEPVKAHYIEEDNTKLVPEQKVDNSLFDKRGMAFGLVGLVTGVVVSALILM